MKIWTAVCGRQQQQLQLLLGHMGTVVKVYMHRQGKGMTSDNWWEPGERMLYCYGPSFNLSSCSKDLRLRVGVAHPLLDTRAHACSSIGRTQAIQWAQHSHCSSAMVQAVPIKQSPYSRNLEAHGMPAHLLTFCQ